ncbi:MAG: DUF2523 family protein [Pseudomonadota bacterium]
MAAPLITGALIGGAMRAAVAGLGIGVVTFAGVDTLLGQLESRIDTQLGAMGPLYGIAALAGLPTAVNIVMSAYTVRLTMAAIKKLRIL